MDINTLVCGLISLLYFLSLSFFKWVNRTPSLKDLNKHKHVQKRIEKDTGNMNHLKIMSIKNNIANIIIHSIE